MMWVGIGCGGLFLLSLIGGVIAGYSAYQAKRVADEMLAAGASTATGATPGAGTDSAGGATGGACSKAAECCRKIVQKSNAGEQAEAGCLMMKQLPDANCEQPLQTYKQSAKLLGVSCD